MSSKAMLIIIKFVNCKTITRVYLFNNITIVNNLVVVATTEFIQKLVIFHGSPHQ
jgi:hypothetical protein